MNARLAIFYAAASLLACACSTPRPRGSVSVPDARGFQTTIADIERTDPASPGLLNAQLAYAGFLLSRGHGPSCADAVNRAQEEIGSVGANPETRVMFPGGWALLASLEYRQHLGRAACGSKADRRDELLAAVDAARRAVERYRNAFDYRSMVIMQFDTAVTLHRLGEKGAVLAALQAALRMDREYGFAQDAREDDRLLLTWRGDPAGAAQVASLMQHFPSRRAVFEFRWHPADAQVRLERDRTFLEDGQIVSSRAAAAFERRIEGDHDGWKVSYSHRVAGYEPGVWASELDSYTRQAAFPPMSFPAVGFKVSGKGKLEGVTDADALSPRLTARTDQLVRARARSGDHPRSAVDDAIAMTAEYLSPGMLEADTLQSYELETAMWIGATLEQGVWYETSAPLSLPGIPQLVIKQRIEFAFTRRVPCDAGAAAGSCVEIVMHATPEEKALSTMLADFGSYAGTRFLSYDGATEARIVVDPATLLPYSLEERIYWYSSMGKGKGDSILESEHLVATTTYHGS